MKHGQPGQRQQDERDGGNPVVRALVRRIADDQPVTPYVARDSIFIVFHRMAPVNGVLPRPHVALRLPLLPTPRSDRSACSGRIPPAPRPRYRQGPAVSPAPSTDKPSG